jgi:hypothetical protein
MNSILKMLTVALIITGMSWTHSAMPMIEHRVLVASDPTDPMPKPKPSFTPGSHNAPVPSGRRG